MANLKVERAKKDLTQSDVADYLGISRAKISMVESSGRDLGELFNYRELSKLAELFDTDVETLVNDD